MRLAIACAALLAAAPVSAQTVLRLHPAKGEVTHYTMTVETYMHGGPLVQMGADTSQPFTRMHSWQTSTVTDASADEFTVSRVLDSVQIESPAMPQMAQMMGGMTDMLKGAIATVRSTSRGFVKSIDVTMPPAVQSMSGPQGQQAMSMARQANGSGPASFVLLPEGPVQVGTSWQDSMVVPVDSAASASANNTFAATFTLKSLANHSAVIDVKGTFNVRGGTMPATTLGVTGQVTLDLAQGRPSAMHAEMNGSAPTPGGDVPITVKVDMKGQ